MSGRRHSDVSTIVFSTYLIEACIAAGVSGGGTREVFKARSAFKGDVTRATGVTKGIFRGTGMGICVFITFTDGSP